MQDREKSEYSELKQKLDKIRAEYAQQLPNRINILKKTWAAYLEERNSEYLNVLFRQAHIAEALRPGLPDFSQRSDAR